MKFMRKIAFVLSLVLSGNITSVLAQESWSLQRCIDHALSHNLQVKQSQLNVEQSKSLEQQSYAAFFPSINGQAGHSYFWGRFIDPYTNIYTNQEVRSSNFGLNATMTIFNGLQLQKELSQSRLSYMASRKDLDKIKNDISLNVVAAYLQVLYNRELNVVTASQVSATQDQRTRINRMFELGSANKSTLLDLESQVANDSARLVSTQAQYEQSILTLAQLLELDTIAGFSVEQPLVQVPSLPGDLSVDAIYGAALKTQPEVESSQYRVIAAEKGLAAAKGARYPRLFISGTMNTNYSTSNQQLTGLVPGTPSVFYSGYTSGGDSVFSIVPNATRQFSEVPFWDQLDNNIGSSLGFTLQVPIFNNWNVKTNVDRARINMQQARLNDEVMRNNLYKSVQQAVLDVSSSRKKYESTLRSVNSTREASELSRQRFELGLINTFEFAQAKNTLALAEANMLQAKYDYIFRLKILDFYQGKPLTF